MKFTTLALAVALAAGSAGVAYAGPTNVISNGDFSATSPTPNQPTQFQSGTGSCGFGNYGGQFVTGWTNTQGYSVWYSSAAAASGQQACTQFGNTGNQFLPSAVTAPPGGSGSFVGMDGEPNWRAAIQQSLSGLTVGGQYTLGFWWASTQEMSRTGDTTEQFQVTVDGNTFLTPVANNTTHGWTPWAYQTFTFTATSANAVLEFLSIGTPGGFPPFALLADVSLTHNVPEPSVLGMFGGGLLGLGLLVMVARRRAERREEMEGGIA